MQGAVEWRKEIEDAIQGCNKFVAFIDMQYLLSFNCMEVSPLDLHPRTKLMLRETAHRMTTACQFMLLHDSCGANSLAMLTL